MMLSCYTKTIKRSSLSRDILYERIKQSDCRENSGTIRTALTHFEHSWPRPLEFDWINLWLLWIHNHMQKTNFIAQLIPYEIDTLCGIIVSMPRHVRPHPLEMTVSICRLYGCLITYKISTSYFNLFVRYCT